ncbi:MAG TPA: fibronectin type III domain-containing protein [Patescibacteria group bacterium]|nr:fibronectin type III domain-containing protein [Patescibacteria group bacterium]
MSLRLSRTYIEHFRFTKSKAVLAFTLLLACLLPLPAVAANQINVTFEKDPLFSEANFAPGQIVTRFAKVKNKTSNTLSLAAMVGSLVPAISPTILQLSDVIDFQVQEGSVTLFNGTLTQFFQSGQVSLGSIAGGDTKTYNFKATFRLNAGNYFQARTSEFDIKIGVASTSNPPGGGGGGGGPPPTAMAITCIQPHQPTSNTERISFCTNLSSLGRIVYGIATSVPIFNPNSSTYGYQFAAGDTLPGTFHDITLRNLRPSTKYAYRVEGRNGNNIAVSEEKYFTTAHERSVAFATYEVEPPTSPADSEVAPVPQTSLRPQTAELQRIPQPVSQDPVPLIVPENGIIAGTATEQGQPEAVLTNTETYVKCQEFNGVFLLGELMFFSLIFVVGYLAAKRRMRRWVVYPAVVCALSMIWWLMFECRPPAVWLLADTVAYVISIAIIKQGHSA